MRLIVTTNGNRNTTESYRVIRSGGAFPTTSARTTPRTSSGRIRSIHTLTTELYPNVASDQSPMAEIPDAVTYRGAAPCPRGGPCGAAGGWWAGTLPERGWLTLHDFGVTLTVMYVLLLVATARATCTTACDADQDG